jgi:hypothetical protein
MVEVSNADLVVAGDAEAAVLVMGFVPGFLLLVRLAALLASHDEMHNPRLPVDRGIRIAQNL